MAPGKFGEFGEWLRIRQITIRQIFPLFKVPRLLPVIEHLILPPLRMKIEQLDDILLGTWPTIRRSPSISFWSATACGSWEFPTSHLQISSSPTYGSDQMAWYL